MLKAAPHRYLKLAGGLIAVAGLVYVAASLRENWSETDFASVDTRLAGALVIMAFVYASSNLLLANAWGRLLRAFGEAPTRRWIHRVFAVTQLGKYVPGNIFQFAGRQIVAVSAGLEGWAVAKSAVLEISLLTLAGSLFAIPLALVRVAGLTPALSIVVFCGVVAVAYAIIWVAWQRETAAVLLLYVSFLAISGSLFAVLFGALDGQHGSQDFLYLAPAFVLAWMAGLITPGAPAGVGIRELTLLVMLQEQFDKPTVLLAVALSRLITVAGDLIFAGAVVGSQWIAGGNERGLRGTW